MARRKSGESKIEIGSLHDISGEVNVAGRDIYKGYTAEQVSVLLTRITSTFQPKPFDGRCPYKGLDVFEEEDAGLFFGRERLMDALVGRVEESRAVFVTGPSGSGKSSLVRAGLIPELKGGTVKNSDRWLFATIKPGRDPIGELGRAVAALAGTTNAEDEIRAKALTDVSIFVRWCEIVLREGREKRFVLFIDQFEEVFTQVSREEERLAFLGLLTTAATAEAGRVILLFAMRSDFLANCAIYPQLNDLINQSKLFQVGSMQPQELVSAIAQPALRVSLRIDPDLIAQIINDMKGEPGALPLMQFALKDLFDTEQSKGGLIALTREAYLRRGGIGEALERHADDSLAELSENEQELARSIFSGLIEVGRGTQDTKRTALFSELVPVNTNAGEVTAVIQKLENARLVTTVEQDSNKYTIAHEKLIDAWPWLKRLVNENRDAIGLQNEIAADAQEWDEHGRDASYLYRGARLANAREQLEAKKLLLSDLGETFVNAAIEVEQAERFREAARQQKELSDARKLAAAETQRAEEQKLAAVKSRRLARFLAVALGAALLAVGAAVFFGLESKRQGDIASARELAAVSITNLDSDPDLSLHLAMESRSRAATVQGEEALRRALTYPAVLLTLRGHSGAISSVAYDSGGKHLVTAGKDKTARIWDATTGHEILTLRGHTAAVNSADFSPDGQLVATASADKTVRIWDAKTGHQLRSIDKHAAAVNSVAFSPDGEYLITASDDKTARVWKVADGGQRYMLEGHTAPVRCAAFSPDGKLMATGGYDATIKIWDTNTGQLVESLSNGSESVEGLAFSPDSQHVVATWLYGAFRWNIASAAYITQYPVRDTWYSHTWYTTKMTFSPSDGQQVVTASSDHTVGIWDTETGNAIEILRGQGGAINGVAFDRSGDHLATASEDGTVRIWNIGEWRKHVLIEPKGYFVDAVYSYGGDRIATAGSDGMIRIWDAASGRQLKAWPYEGYVANRLHFSPDDKQLITSSDDGTWRLWDVASGSQLYESDSMGYLVSDARFNSGGTQIITTQKDNSGKNNVAAIWDAKTRKSLIQLKGHNAGLWTGMFSPNGRLAVTAGADPAAIIWDVQTGKPLHRLEGHTALVTSAAFSQDGKRIVTTSVDTTARIWDTATGRLLFVLKGHTREVTDAVFSPTDPYIATSGADHTVILWNADTGEEIVQLFGHNNVVRSVAFSPDGKELLTSSVDGTARIYPVHFADVVALAESITAPREFTCAELVKYLHGRGPCPTATSALTPTP